MNLNIRFAVTESANVSAPEIHTQLGRHSP
jgi:hypothetical protein